MKSSRFQFLTCTKFSGDNINPSLIGILSIKYAKIEDVYLLYKTVRFKAFHLLFAHGYINKYKITKMGKQGFEPRAVAFFKMSKTIPKATMFPLHHLPLIVINFRVVYENFDSKQKKMLLQICSFTKYLTKFAGFSRNIEIYRFSILTRLWINFYYYCTFFFGNIR